MSKALHFSNKRLKMGQYLADTHFLFEQEALRANQETGSTHDVYNIKDKKIEFNGYPCIHLWPDEFCNAMNLVKTQFKKQNISGLKFLDIGCGVGEKIFWANKIYGLKADGIELRKPIAESAKRMTRQCYESTIFNQSALEFADYNKYDIIYFYVPIANHEVELEMETLVAKNAKPGAIVVGFGAYLFNMFNTGVFSLDEQNEGKKLLKNWTPVQINGKPHSISHIWRKNA